MRDFCRNVGVLDEGLDRMRTDWGRTGLEWEGIVGHFVISFGMCSQLEEW